MLLALVALAANAIAAPPNTKTPNVVIIFCDDLGYGDIGVYGAKGYTTPNIDRLAAEGNRFTRFYVPQPVCSASRAGLMTGCYPNRIGIKGALGPKAPVGISDSEMTLAELVKQRDYATAIFGKWHLGDAPQFLPPRHGFDEYLGLPYSNDMWPFHPEFVNRPAGKGGFPALPLIDGERVVNANVTSDDQRQLTTQYTQRAVQFIERSKDRPFFLYLAHSMPHVPLHVSDKYKGKSEQGLFGDVIEEIDWSVGQVLETLAKHKLDERTLVIFSSDNGPWLSYGNHAGSAGPLREGKGTCWDGGVREPFIARWKGVIPAGHVTNEPAMTIDLFPTIARLIDAKLPDHKIDGLDVWPLLVGEAGAKNPHEAYYFYFNDNELQAVSSGTLKLQLPHTYRTLAGRAGGRDGQPGQYEQRKITEPELYELATDIGETNDLAAARPDDVKRLLALADKAREDLGDSLVKRTGSTVRQPGRVAPAPNQGAAVPDKVRNVVATASEGATPTPARRNAELEVTDRDRQHWAFRPLGRPALPTVTAGAWVRNPIDQFILQALEARGLRPAPEATARTLARRVYFDLHGLPPETEIVEALSNDAQQLNDAAYATLVEQLLASQHYGERWGRHWLDLARYADSDGQEGDADRPDAYHYRDFVIRALNGDLPYDTFVRWQLAGDEIDPDNPQAIAATGFLSAGTFTKLDVPMEDEKLRNHFNELDDMLATIGSGLLGLSVQCARCHDHKYDPIPARDYYRMLAVVHSGKRGDVLLATRAEVEAFTRNFAEWKTRFDVVDGQLNTWLKDHKTPLEARLRGEKIAALEISEEEKSVLNSSTSTDQARKLSKQHDRALKLSDDDFKRLMTEVEQAQWSELTAARDKVRADEPASPPKTLGFRDLGPQPAAMWLFERGDFYDRDEPVTVGFLSVLMPTRSAEDYWTAARADVPLAGSSYQRKAMAAWLTDVDHGAGALLARVIVNRIWQHHFGEGLVRTVNDFGVQGAGPTHPELLEWLARDLVDHGWRLKRLHRLIVSSAAYRQSAAGGERAASLDPDNLLLWHRRPQRLEAEILRDAMLASSDTLERAPYGPAFKPSIVREAIVARNVKDPYPRKVSDSPEVRRRSVYMFHKRVVPYPLFQAFDAPDALQTCGRRNGTTVATQALAMFNDPFVRQQSLAMADRLRRDSVDEPAGWIGRGYLLAFSRPATESESRASLDFVTSQIERRRQRDPELPLDEVRRQALADLCQSWFSLNEFMYVD